MAAKKKTGKSLAVLPPVERAVVAIGISPEREKELIALAASTADIVSITNDDGYKQVDSARKALKRERLAIEEICEESREDAQKFAKAVIARQKYLVGLTKPEEDRLQKLQEERDAEIERQRQAEIDAELARQAALRERIAELRANRMLTPASGSKLIREHIEDIERISIDETFAEFLEEARAAKAEGLDWLAALLEAARVQETEAQRLADERAETERQRAALRLQQEELDRKTREQEQAAQAERDRIAAEQKKLDDEKAALARQQEELRVASLPHQPPVAESPAVEAPDECTFPASAVVQEGRFGADMKTSPSAPTANEIISALVDLYGESDETVLTWLRSIDWNAEVSEAA